MPLIDGGKGPVPITAENYVNSRTAALSKAPQPEPEKRALSPQPNSGRERSQHRQPEGGKKAQDFNQNKENHAPVTRKEAVKLKMEVPTTMPKSKLAQSVPVTNAAPHAARPQFALYGQSMTAGEDRINVFDDTGSIHFDDSTSFINDQDGQIGSHLILAPGPRDSALHSGSLPGQASGKHANQKPPPQEQTLLQPTDWMREADDERLLRGLEPKYGPTHDDNYYEHEGDDESDDAYEQGREFEEGHSTIENTPSRTRTMPEQRLPVDTRPIVTTNSAKNKASGARTAAVVHKKSRSDMGPPPIATSRPLVQTHRGNDRFHTGHGGQQTNAEIVGLSDTQELPYDNRPYSQVFEKAPFASKASSLQDHSSSEEEQPLPARNIEAFKPVLKRPHPSYDLDFDVEALEKKSMDDLDAIPFPTDPRQPTPAPALDSNGNPLTVAAKLTNLTKMRPEDQSTLFQTLADADREQTAQWFFETFRSDMERLMAVRADRRKIALKYELEVKKREKQVDTKRQDVEQELKGLKEGGDELVNRTPRGKSPEKV